MRREEHAKYIWLSSVASVSLLKTIYKLLPFGTSCKKLKMIYLNVPFTASSLLLE